MAVKTLEDLQLENKRVLVRVDFNVPLKEGRITDDTRIRASLPTLQYILGKPGTRLIVMSHLGRPKGKASPEFSLKPTAQRLGELLGRPVIMADDCIGTTEKGHPHLAFPCWSGRCNSEDPVVELDPLS